VREEMDVGGGGKGAEGEAGMLAMYVVLYVEL